MIYSSFLTKSSRFKSKNNFRLENKKKNSKIFLFSSVITIAVLSIFITFFIDTDRNTLAHASSSSSLSKTTTAVLTQADDANVDSKVFLPEDTIAVDSKVATVEKTEFLTTKPIKTEILKTISPQQVTITAPVKSTTTKKVVVKKGDTLSAIFKRSSLSASTLHKIINSSKQAKRLTRIKPGQELVITFNSNNTFKSLHYNIDRVDSLIVEKKPDSKDYAVRIESKDIDTRQQFATGIINNSLFSAGNKAVLSNSMIMQLAQLFGWDIDFALDIRKGDSFAILFEEKYIDDKKIGNGNILSAEFVNRGKVFTAIRYTDSANHTDYYSEDGLSMRKAFLRTPVDFSRISSRFSSGRKHPVLNQIRAHKGVDYAAARGTPIKAVGDGKVIFKGKKGGYGRVIILQHGSKYSTLYAHMNSYNKKMRHGTRVKQGQVIGYVGSSGLATGPHLHYEFRLNGVQRNPLTIPLPSASPIAKKYRNDFQATAETMISQLKLRKQETVALSEQ